MSYPDFSHWTLYAGINNIFNRTPWCGPVWQYESRSYDDSWLFLACVICMQRL